MSRFNVMAFTGCVLSLALVTPTQAGLAYDQDVTPDVIFGSGNANGAFTVDRNDSIELGLRAKLRHNASGLSENTFNSNGNGTYTFQPGVAPTQSFPTAEWSFEWSINVDYNGTSSLSLNDLTYELEMTSTNGAFITAFDPINQSYVDHAIGTNLTGNGGGDVAVDAVEYATLIDNNNVAQNSWKPHWFATNFNPNLSGTYFFTLSAYEGANQVASTTMSVNVVPEPTAAVLSLVGLASLTLMRRR